MISVHQLTKRYPLKNRTLTVLNNASFSISEGETLGLVGESGSGKSTLGKCLLHLEPPSSGSIVYKGRALDTFSKKELFDFRKEAQVIFQDPYASLNPRMTAADLIAEPLRIHRTHTEQEIPKTLHTLLDLVGLPSTSLGRFPHEFSGGQRQRIGIARALALKPRFLVCDEPISALDVSVQAQIVNLLKGLQKELGLTYLFIAHDLAMVKYLSDRVAVLYLGHIVEIAPAEELYNTPQHPYTQALLASIPVPDPLIERSRPKPALHGEIPQIASPGCPFACRCPHATDLCRTTPPPLVQLTPTHQVSCHLKP
ncbi:MAG: ATP-binding cassette domain-containing protein [Verrucomicrobia bacterium]|nr:ATP-binding cassette domain-containing protein [Verrucomicrobiota bacterium]